LFSQFFSLRALAGNNSATKKKTDVHQLQMNDHRLKPVVSIQSEPLRFHRLKAVVSSRMKKG